MNKDECQTADWKERGFQDGLKGKAATYLSSHTKACSEHGITPNAELYRSGRAKGIVTFCTPDNAYSYGSKGRRYTRGTCPANLEKAFLQKYNMAKKIYSLRSDIRRLVAQIEKNEKLIIESELSPLERQKLMYQNKDLSKQKESKTKKLYYLEGKSGMKSADELMM